MRAWGVMAGCLLGLWAVAPWAEPLAVRLKDVAKLVEARDNQLIGYGLVVGLRNTGDTRLTGFTDSALSSMLKRMGISPSGRDFTSRNVASVMVTATLPSYIRKGQRISVTVSSLGDATSLSGGTLILTPLIGPDMNTYAVAQGNLVVGGQAEQSTQGRFTKNQPTSATIPNGAIVEEEVPVSMSDLHHIVFVLNEPNFATATNAVQAIRANGYKNAVARDAAMIAIPNSDLPSGGGDLVTEIATLQNITFLPDASAKVVLDSRSGTIVIGEMVRLAPVALTHGSISIRITDAQQVMGIGGGEAAADPTGIRVEEANNRFVYLNPSSTLSSLVTALNDIGASPRDLVSIIQALKAAGSLIAELEIL